MKRSMRLWVSLALFSGCGKPAPERRPAAVDPARVDAAVAVAHATTDAAAPPDAAVPDAAPPQPIVIAAVGDLMLGTTHPRPRLPPDDGAALLAEVTPVLSAADVAFGNLEAPLYDGNARPHCTPGAIAERSHGRPGGTTCWSFRTPARYGAHLRAAGFDVVSLANNHADDFGPDGRASTLDVLDELGIAHTGPTGTVARLEVHGATVDVIAFATDAGLNSMDDHDAAAALIGGSDADVVVVSFHGGAEGPGAMHTPDGAETFFGQHRGAVRAFAHAAIDAGADLVVGHGPHVVRGLEFYRGRLIAYSLGSFATYRGINVAGVRGRTMILEAHLLPDGSWAGGRVVSARQVRPHGPRPDDPAWLVAKLRALSTADFGDRAAVIADDGTVSPP